MTLRHALRVVVGGPFPRLSSVAVALALAVALAPERAFAADEKEPPAPHRMRFEEVARPVGPIDILVTGVLLGTWAGLQLGVPLSPEPRWRDVGGFDGGVRRALLAETAAGRRTAGMMSDLFWLSPMIWAAADGAAVPLITDRGNFHLAWQLTVINVESFSLAGIFARGGHIAFARRRPDVSPCGRDEEYHANCGAAPTASFPSGHATGAMAGAGLVCAHHSALPLYGGGWPDVGACVLATTMGLSSGVLRVVGDRHYATDVIAGDLLGFGAGFALPMLLHYAPWYDRSPAAPSSAGSAARSAKSWAPRWQLVPSAPSAVGGASFVGVW